MSTVGDASKKAVTPQPEPAQPDPPPVDAEQTDPKPPDAKPADAKKGDAKPGDARAPAPPKTKDAKKPDDVVPKDVVVVEGDERAKAPDTQAKEKKDGVKVDAPEKTEKIEAPKIEGLPSNDAATTNATGYDASLKKATANPDDAEAGKAAAAAQKKAYADRDAYAAYLNNPEVDKKSAEYKQVKARYDNLNWSLQKTEAHFRASQAKNDPDFKREIGAMTDPKSTKGRRLQRRMNNEWVQVKEADLEVYYTTGQMTPAMEKTFNQVRKTGDYPQLGVVLSAQTMRVRYLRHEASKMKDGPEKTARMKQADALEKQNKRLPRQAKGTKLRHSNSLNKTGLKLEAQAMKLPEGDPKREAKLDRSKQLIKAANRNYAGIVRDAKKYPKSRYYQRIGGQARLGQASIVDQSGQRTATAGQKKYAADMKAWEAGGRKGDKPTPPKVPVEWQRAKINPEGVDAIYDDAEKINPRLKTDVTHRKRRRGHIRKRLAINTTRMNALYPADSPKAPESRLATDVAVDRLDLRNKNAQRSKELGKVEPGKLTEEQRQEYNQVNKEHSQLSAQITEDAKRYDRSKAADDNNKAQAGMATDRLKWIDGRRGDIKDAKAKRIAKEWDAKLAKAAGNPRALKAIMEDPDFQSFKKWPNTYINRAPYSESEQQDIARLDASEKTAKDILDGLPPQTVTEERVKAAKVYDQALKDAHTELGLKQPGPNRYLKESKDLIVAADEHFDHPDTPALDRYNHNIGAQQLGVAWSNDAKKDAVKNQHEANAAGWRATLQGRKLDGPRKREEKLQKKAMERGNEKREYYQLGPDGRAVRRDNVPPMVGKDKYVAIGMNPYAPPGSQKGGGTRSMAYLFTEKEHQEYKAVLQEKKGLLVDLRKHRADVKSANQAYDAARNESAEAFGFAKGRLAKAEKARAEANQQIDADLAKASKGKSRTRKRRLAHQAQLQNDQLALTSVNAHVQTADAGWATNGPEATSILVDAHTITNNELPLVDVDGAKTKADKEFGLIRNQARTDALQSVSDSAIRGKKTMDGPGARHRLLQNKHTNSIELGRATGELVILLGVAGGETDEAIRAFNDHAAKNDPDTAKVVASQKEYYARSAEANGVRKEQFAKWETEVDFVALSDAGVARTAKDLKGLKKYTKDMREHFAARTDGSVGWFSNKAMWVVSGGTDIRSEMKKTDSEAFDRVDADGDRAAYDYRNGFKAIAMNKGVRGNYELAGVLRDPRATLYPGDARYQAWYKEVEQMYGPDRAKAMAGLVKDNPHMAMYRNGGSSSTEKVADTLKDPNDTLNMFQPQMEATYNTYKFLDGARKEHVETLGVKMLNLGMEVGAMVLGSAALAPVAAGLSSVTGAARLFAAGRATFSGSRLGLFAVNAAEAGTGLLAGKMMHKAGVALGFKEGSGAMWFMDALGGGFNLGVANRVAMQSGLKFQYGLGLAMGGVPVVAEELGVNPELAAFLGDAVGIFAPAVMGTMANRRTARVTERAMDGANLSGSQRKAVMKEVFTKEAYNPHMDVDGVAQRAVLDQRLKGRGMDGPSRQRVLDGWALERSLAAHDAPELRKGADAKQQMKDVERYYENVEKSLVEHGVDPKRAKQLVTREKTAMFDGAIEQTNRHLAAEHDSRPVGYETRLDLDKAPANQDQPPANADTVKGEKPGGAMPDTKPEHTGPIRLKTRIENPDGSITFKDAHGYKLLAVDDAAGTATVESPTGRKVEVPLDEVVYEHNGLALGANLPAVQRRFMERYNGLSPEDQYMWSNMLGDARQVSPEHAVFLTRMFAIGEDFTMMRAELDWARSIPQQKLGEHLSMRGLTQHLSDSCAATAAQWGLGARHPGYGRALTDYQRSAARQQRGWLKRGEGKSSPRDPNVDPDYRPATRDNPLSGEDFVGAHHVADADINPALAKAKDPDARVYKPSALDLTELDVDLWRAVQGDGEVAIAVQRKIDGADMVVKITDVQQRDGIWQMRVDGHWVPMSTLKLEANGLTLNGHEVLQIAAPKGVEMQSPHKSAGMWIDRQPLIMDDLEIVTGARYRQEGLTGDADGATIDYMAEILAEGYPIPLVVEWDGGGLHQIWVDQVRPDPHNPTQKQFLVYDPWYPQGKWVSPNDLLNYQPGPNRGTIHTLNVPTEAIRIPVRGDVFVESGVVPKPKAAVAPEPKAAVAPKPKAAVAPEPKPAVAPEPKAEVVPRQNAEGDAPGSSKPKPPPAPLPDNMAKAAEGLRGQKIDGVEVTADHTAGLEAYWRAMPPDQRKLVAKGFADSPPELHGPLLMGMASEGMARQRCDLVNRAIYAKKRHENRTAVSGDDMAAMDAVGNKTVAQLEAEAKSLRDVHKTFPEPDTNPKGPGPEGFDGAFAAKTRKGMLDRAIVAGEKFDKGYALLPQDTEALQAVGGLSTADLKTQRHLLRHQHPEVFGDGRVLTSKQSLDNVVDWLWQEGDGIQNADDVYAYYKQTSEPNELTATAENQRQVRDGYLQRVYELTQNRPDNSLFFVQGKRRGVSPEIIGDHLSGKTPSTSLDRGFYHFYRAGGADSATERVYINAAADHATEVMSFVVRDIIDNPQAYPGIKAAKVAGPQSAGTRAENIVIYADSPEARDRVVAAVEKYQLNHPDHFKNGTPKMTHQVLPGVAIAANPSAVTKQAMYNHLPPKVADQWLSFGGTRAFALHLALQDTRKANGDSAYLRAQVEKRFTEFGIPMDAPHRNAPGASDE